MLGLIGVPSSAGAHGPGQEKAPAALRQAGLLGALREAGLTVEDLGDLPMTRFEPDPAHRKSQSLSRVVAVARQVAERVTTAADRRRRTRAGPHRPTISAPRAGPDRFIWLSTL